MRGIIRFAIVCVAAVAHSISVAWPFDLFFARGYPVWWLHFAALATLGFLLLRCRSAGCSALLGFVFTSVWLGTTFSWLFVAMHTFGGLHGVLAVMGVAALAMALSLYYAAACYVFWRLPSQKTGALALLFSALWTLAELARGNWLTGFGWGAVAYAHVDGPLGFYAPWVGAYGVGALAAWVSVSLALLRRASMAHRVGLILVLGLPWLVPAELNNWSHPTGSLSVTLLQGNIPQNEKFEASSGIPAALGWYRQQFMKSSTDLLVAPETAIPVLPQQLPDGYWSEMTMHLGAGGRAALVGVPLGSYHDGYTNSVVGISQQQADIWRYDKHHLVPFGEFIPTFFKWFTQMMHIPLGDFNRGAVGQPSFEVLGQRIAANICYEDLFGEELGVRFTDADKAPTLFANVSNMGWFGDTLAIDQHLQISRMRSLEFQRPFVRATNTGATVIMDHHAQITTALAQHSRGVLIGRVEGRSGNTPYAWWVSRLGLWPVWLLALAVVLWRSVRGHSKVGT